MYSFPSDEWMNQLCKLCNQDKMFGELSQWFHGGICLNVGEKSCDFTYSNGLLSVGPSDEGQKIIISGPTEVWDKIRKGQPGGIHRAFRHQTLKFSGDMVEVMRNWKVIWRLGEVIQCVDK